MGCGASKADVVNAQAPVPVESHKSKKGKDKLSKKEKKAAKKLAREIAEAEGECACNSISIVVCAHSWGLF